MTINFVESSEKSTLITEALDSEKPKIRKRLSKVFDESFTTEPKYHTTPSSSPHHKKISGSKMTFPVHEALLEKFLKAYPAQDTTDVTDISKSLPKENRLYPNSSKVTSKDTTSVVTAATAGPSQSVSKVKIILKKAFEFIHELLNDLANPKLISVAETHNLYASQLTTAYLLASNDLDDVEFQVFRKLVINFLILDSAKNYSNSPYTINSISSNIPSSSFSRENVDSLSNFISDMIHIDIQLANQFCECCLPTYVSSHINEDDVNKVITQMRSDSKNQLIKNSLLTQTFFYKLTRKKRDAIASSFLAETSTKHMMKQLACIQMTKP